MASFPSGARKARTGPTALRLINTGSYVIISDIYGLLHRPLTRPITVVCVRELTPRDRSVSLVPLRAKDSRRRSGGSLAAGSRSRRFLTGLLLLLLYSQPREVLPPRSRTRTSNGRGLVGYSCMSIDSRSTPQSCEGNRSHVFIRYSHRGVPDRIHINHHGSSPDQL